MTRHDHTHDEGRSRHMMFITGLRLRAPMMVCTTFVTKTTRKYAWASRQRRVHKWGKGAYNAVA
jgi:hypothetical protein